MIEILWHSLFSDDKYPSNISVNSFPYYDIIFKDLIKVKSCLNKQRKVHYSHVRLYKKSVITLDNQRANVIFYEY